jgi:NTP pyrophosphatase (non-canonical NTP hydrolase)
MNPDEIDVMKLTPEDYLKMRDRCKELERNNILQHEHILELERVNAELSGAIHRMHGGCERAVELRKLLDELFDVGRNEVVSDDEIRKRMKNLQNELAQLRKENCRVYNQRNQLADEKKQQAAYILELREELERIRRAANNSIDSSQTALKDADAKIQSANDRAANAKKEAKEAKERAESASERVRYLERKLRDVESLNDSLIKELVRRQEALRQVIDNDADAYQQNVLKYAPDHHDYLLNVIYAAMGMCGEAGEASELVKKYAYHDHAIDTEHLARELGDVLWYVSYMAHLFGYPLGKIMAMNQEKLAKRYPDGKFDAERSRNREEGDI